VKPLDTFQCGRHAWTAPCGRRSQVRQMRCTIIQSHSRTGCGNVLQDNHQLSIASPSRTRCYSGSVTAGEVDWRMGSIRTCGIHPLRSRRRRRNETTQKRTERRCHDCRVVRCSRVPLKLSFSTSVCSKRRQRELPHCRLLTAVEECSCLIFRIDYESVSR
jgi:hypothetical protein